MLSLHLISPEPVAPELVAGAVPCLDVSVVVPAFGLNGVVVLNISEVLALDAALAYLAREVGPSALEPLEVWKDDFRA